MEQKKSYLSKMADQLKRIDKDIKELRNKADSVSVRTREEYNFVIADLKARRNTIEEKIKTAQSAGSEAWDTLKGGLDTSYNEFVKAFSDAVNRLKKN